VLSRDADWVDVIIDDQLFLVTPRWEALDTKVGDLSDQIPSRKSHKGRYKQQQDLYHKDRDQYEKVGRKGSKVLYFARGENENETWVYVNFHILTYGIAQ
jgi:hypothetical protein